MPGTFTYLHDQFVVLSKYPDANYDTCYDDGCHQNDDDGRNDTFLR